MATDIIPIGATTEVFRLSAVLNHGARRSRPARRVAHGLRRTPPPTRAARPHAVVNAAGLDYLYDANGNLASTAGAVSRTHEWASFDLPVKMEAAGRRIEWKYGPQRQRVVTTTTHGSLTRTQYLVHPDARGGLFFEREVIATNGVVSRIENRHYLMVAGAGVIGVVKTEGEGNGTAPSTAAGIARAVADLTQYWHKDPLGSIVAVTNARGELIERMAYDAWGRRMQASGAPDTGSLAAGTLLDAAHGDRGFTGHEMLDELGLVHMNGRIYDPALGRFFSPDPFVQAPALLASYNRYAYVLNNPLSYTDPDGQIVWHVAAFIVGVALISEGNRHWKMVGTVLVAWALGGKGGLVEAGLGKATTTAAAFGQGFIAGFGTGLIAGGDFEDAMIGAFAGGALGATGFSLKGPQAVLAHALIGCARAAASGGECGPAAAAAAFGKATTGHFDAPGSFADMAATTIVGGTAAVIGGGKFANGAFTAAFQYVLNQLSGRRGGCVPNSAGNVDLCVYGDRESPEWKAEKARVDKIIAAAGDGAAIGAGAAILLCSSGPQAAACLIAAGATVATGTAIKHGFDPDIRMLAVDMVTTGAALFLPQSLSAQSTYFFATEIAKQAVPYAVDAWRAKSPALPVYDKWDAKAR